MKTRQTPQSRVSQKPLIDVSSVEEVRNLVHEIKKHGQRVALVPTMGALHEGHLKLIEVAKEHADKVITSIFVNPMQFGPGEDFDSYPRTLEEDKNKILHAGGDVVYFPGVQEMYPDGFDTCIQVGGVSDGLCGAMRPGHFNGVSTVVSKLFLQVKPDVALFGEKDYQQLCVIKKMVRDLNIDIKIIGVPTVRDSRGLALSSRNKYLNESQYKIAVCLNQILFEMAQRIGEQQEIKKVTEWGAQRLQDSGFDKVDYLEVRDSATLDKAETKTDRPLRILAAVRLGKARLIDNVPA
jgi:pantoate--beta-alanine ligase